MVHPPQNGSIGFDPQPHGWSLGIDGPCGNEWLFPSYKKCFTLCSGTQTAPTFGKPTSRDMAVGQNQWYHFGVGAPSILVCFSGNWDVHWGYGGNQGIPPYPRSLRIPACSFVQLSNNRRGEITCKQTLTFRCHSSKRLSTTEFDRRHARKIELLTADTILWNVTEGSWKTMFI